MWRAISARAHDERFRDDDRFLDEPFREELFLDELFRGTFAPFFRASDRPIAIACFRLFTVPPFPPGPDFSVPRFLRRIALATFLLAARPYLRVPDFRPDFFRVAIGTSVESSRTIVFEWRDAGASAIPLPFVRTIHPSTARAS